MAKITKRGSLFMVRSTLEGRLIEKSFKTEEEAKQVMEEIVIQRANLKLDRNKKNQLKALFGKRGGAKQIEKEMDYQMQRLYCKAHRETIFGVEHPDLLI